MYWTDRPRRWWHVKIIWRRRLEDGKVKDSGVVVQDPALKPLTLWSSPTGSRVQPTSATRKETAVKEKQRADSEGEDWWGPSLSSATIPAYGPARQQVRLCYWQITTLTERHMQQNHFGRRLEMMTYLKSRMLKRNPHVNLRRRHRSPLMTHRTMSWREDFQGVRNSAGHQKLWENWKQSYCTALFLCKAS